MATALPLSGVRIALRADAGHAIGHGHVVRSLALGAALVGLGGECRLVTRMANPPSPTAIVIPDHVEPPDEAQWLAARRWQPDVIVLDMFPPDPAQTAGYGSTDRLTVAVDDAHPEHDFEVDLLVNPSLNRSVRHLPGPTTEYLAGPGYLLLRAGFESKAARTISPRLDHALVCFGGSDPLDLTPRVAHWLAERRVVPRVTLAIGNGFGDPEGLRRQVRPHRSWLTVEQDADVVALMRSADAGVLAAGTLAYEAAALGLPAVLVSLNEPQRLEADVLASHGAAKHLTSSALDAEEVTSSLRALGEPAARRSMSAAGPSLVDGAGSRRVAEHIGGMWQQRRGGAT